MKILLVRHGKTSGNMEHRYIGRTDEPLCELGRQLLTEQYEEINQLEVDGQRIKPMKIFCSPMKRCVETRKILFPEISETDIQVVSNLRESDFGHFEGKNYQELDGNPEYQEWVDRNCDGQIPGGEHLDDFRKRCSDAFREIILSNRYVEQIGVVAHGGVIMVLLEAFHKDHRPFHEYHMNNGACYICEWDGNDALELEILARKG